MDDLLEMYPDRTGGLEIVRAVEQPASGSASHWDERTATILTWKQVAFAPDQTWIPMMPG
jgi:hypothetical protein